MRPTILFAAVAVAASLGSGTPALAAAGDDHADLHIEIQGEDHHGLSLSLGGWAADILRAAMPSVIHCRSDHDDRVVTVLRFLDRHGEGSRYTLWDDGREFSGWRRHGRFELRIGERPHWHHGAAHIEAPWSLAQCMLGGTIRTRDLLDAGDSGLDLLIADDEGRVHLSLH